MASLIRVEGIGKKNAKKLVKAGVSSTDALLKQGGTSRASLLDARSRTITEKLILEWVNHVVLFRIKCIFEEYADLLEEAGVDTVVELARRNPENLYKKMGEVNASKNLVRQLPGQSQVADWVAQAKKLPRAVSH